MHEQFNSVSREAKIVAGGHDWLLNYVEQTLLPLGQDWSKCGHTCELDFDKILLQTLLCQKQQGLPQNGGFCP